MIKHAPRGNPMPPVIKLTPQRIAELDKMKRDLDALLESCYKNLDYLALRWGDEHEYEDFAEYEKVMRDYIKNADITFVKATKRPFGFQVKHKFGATHTIQFYVKGKRISWGRVA